MDINKINLIKTKYHSPFNNLRLCEIFKRHFLTQKHGNYVEIFSMFKISLGT